MLTFKILMAIAVAVMMMRMGIAVLRALATPIPEPPPVGELRKVKLQYRCSLCGTEVRMTVAPDEAPTRRVTAWTTWSSRPPRSDPPSMGASRLFKRAFQAMVFHRVGTHLWANHRDVIPRCDPVRSPEPSTGQVSGTGWR